MLTLRELISLFLGVSKARLLIIFALTVAHQILMLLPAILLGKIIDHLYLDTDPQATITYFFLAAFGACILWPTQLGYICKNYHDTTAKMGVRWAMSLLKKDLAFFRNSRMGEILRSYDRGMKNFPWALQIMVEQLFFGGIKILIMFGYLVYLGAEWSLALLTLFFLLSIFISMHIVKMQKPEMRKGMQAEEDLSLTQAELLEAFLSVQTSGAQSTAPRVLEGAFDRTERHDHRVAILESYLESLQVLCPGAFSVLIILVSVYFDSHLKGGDFVPIFVFSSEVLRMTLEFVNSGAYLELIKELTHKFELIHTTPTQRQGLTDKGLGHPHLSLQPFKIPFSDQEKAGPHLINTHRIDIVRGSNVAIIGPSGQGKTTLAELISGLRWSEGAISMGQYDMSEVSQKDLVECLYFAQKETPMMEGSLKEGLFYGASVNPELINDILTQLGASHLSTWLKDADKTELSTGELRCLGILRAFTLKRSIMIFDEPTESMTGDQAHKAWEAIFNYSNKSTLICLTHDTVALDRFDQIIEIKSHVLHDIS